MSDHSNKQKEKYRMQKKLLGRWGAVALAATLTASVVTGCGSDSEDAATNTEGTIGIAYSLGGRDVPGFNQLAYIGVEPLLAANPSLELIESQDNPTATDDQRADWRASFRSDYRNLWSREFRKNHTDPPRDCGGST